MTAWGMTSANVAQNHELSKHLSEHLIQAGYVWLFAVSAFFLARLLLDAVMVRRPLLEPNLSAGGLTFTGASLLVFLMANVITCPHERLEYLLAKQRLENVLAKPEVSPPSAPGYPWFDKFSDFSNEVMIHPAPVQPEARHAALIHAAATHAAAILAHLAVVVGMVWIGFRHFDNIHTGVAAATLYLLCFYTSQLTSQVDHVVPAMLLVWAVAAYRRPMLAGVLLGLAAGLIYYPLFLLPLWLAFYWRRGVVRFAFGVVLALAVLAASLVWLPPPDMGPLAASAADVRPAESPERQAHGFLGVLRSELSDSGDRPVRGDLRRPGDLAGA